VRQSLICEWGPKSVTAIFLSDVDFILRASNFGDLAGAYELTVKSLTVTPLQRAIFRRLEDVVSSFFHYISLMCVIFLLTLSLFDILT